MPDHVVVTIYPVNITPFTTLRSRMPALSSRTTIQGLSHSICQLLHDPTSRKIDQSLSNSQWLFQPSSKKIHNITAQPAQPVTPRSQQFGSSISLYSSAAQIFSKKCHDTTADQLVVRHSLLSMFLAPLSMHGGVLRQTWVSPHVAQRIQPLLLCLLSMVSTTVLFLFEIRSQAFCF